MATHRISWTAKVLLGALLGVSLLIYGEWRLTRPPRIFFAKVTNVADVPDIPTQLLGLPFDGDVFAAQRSGWAGPYATTWLVGRLRHPFGNIEGQRDVSLQRTIEQVVHRDRIWGDIIRAARREYNVPEIDYGRVCDLSIFTFKDQSYCEVYYDKDSGHVFVRVIVKQWRRRELGELTVGTPARFKPLE